MGEVTVTVNGRPYRMACEDGQEGHLRELGNELAGQVEALVGQVGQVGDAQLLVMAALITADSLKAVEAAGGGDGGADVSAIQAERDALAAELDRLKQDHAALKQSLDAKLSAEADQAAAIAALTERVDRLTQTLG